MRRNGFAAQAHPSHLRIGCGQRSRLQRGAGLTATDLRGSVMAQRDLPAPGIVRQMLRYEPDTGRLFWLERPEHLFQEAPNRSLAHSAAVWNATFASKEAFTAINSEGYRTGALMRIPMRAHRVVWAVVTGTWPSDQIDHINGDRADNRWENLREVSHALNQRNMKISRSNTTGFCGVRLVRSGKYEVTIGAGGKNRFIGTFESLKEAVAARRGLEQQLGYHPNHGRSTGTVPRTSAK